MVNTTNVISGNSVGTIGSYSLGGGIAAYTNAIYPGDTSKIVISTNTIDGNTALAAFGGYASYGGGVAVVTYGNGQETVEIRDNNTIRNNVAEGYGGGVAAIVGEGAVGAMDGVWLVWRVPVRPAWLTNPGRAWQ